MIGDAELMPCIFIREWTYFHGNPTLKSYGWRGATWLPKKRDATDLSSEVFANGCLFRTTKIAE